MFWGQICQEPERKSNGVPPFCCCCHCFKFPWRLLELTAHPLIEPLTEKFINYVLTFVWANGYVQIISFHLSRIFPVLHITDAEPESQQWSPSPTSHSNGVRRPRLSFGPALSTTPLYTVWSLFLNCLCLRSVVSICRGLITSKKQQLLTLSLPPFPHVLPELLILKHGLKILPNNFSLKITI